MYFRYRHFIATYFQKMGYEPRPTDTFEIRIKLLTNSSNLSQNLKYAVQI